MCPKTLPLHIISDEALCASVKCVLLQGVIPYSASTFSRATLPALLITCAFLVFVEELVLGRSFLLADRSF